MLTWPSLALRCLWLLSAQAGETNDDGASTPSADPMSMAVIDLEFEGEVVPGSVIVPRAFVTNLSSQAITLFHAGDGSDEFWRPSFTQFVVDGVRQRSFGPRCGNRNTLTADDVLVVEPGKRAEVRLTFCHGATLAEEGRHDVQLVLSWDPKPELGGVQLGDDDPAVLEVIARTPAYRIVSRPLVVDVRPARHQLVPIAELATRPDSKGVVRELRWVLEARRAQKDRPLSKVESDTLLALEFLDEVERRGLGGYFWHERANQHDDIVRALRALGATADADTLEALARDFPGGAMPRDVDERQAAMETEQGKKWRISVDDRLKRNPESWSRLALTDDIPTYFRTHVADFTDP